MKPWQLPMRTESQPDGLRGFGLVTAMLVPLGLLHAWVLAEVMIGLTDILFLAAMLRRRDFTWARSPWFIAAMLWWVWLVFCSIPIFFTTASIRMGLLEAIVIIRMLLFAAALQHWLLTTARTRSFAWWVLALSCLWIGLESWQQYLTGKNIFGDHRFGDGALTGPFFKPRAGALYAHLLYLALLPPLIAIYAKGRIWQLAALALAVLGVVTSVLIGQRSPTILAGFGLVVAAFFYPQLRRIAIIAALAAIAFLAATPIISPPTYGKLIGETSRQVAHFALSPYGQIWTRGIVMGLASPLHGWGYNGFRELCPQPRFGAGLPALGLAPTQLALGACNLHPHSYYIQAFTDAGIPGLILFVLLIAIWFRMLSAGLLKNPDPVRVGLFIFFFTFVWPFETTDAFPTLYMLGWFFFALGLGLAHTHIAPEPAGAKIPGPILKSEPANA
jgi:O-antigen ligase